MKQILLLCTSVLTLDSAAQAVLHHYEMLPPGGSWTMAPIGNLGIIDTTQQGANATWDLTALTTAPGQSNLIVTVAEPANTPYAANFPDANYVFVE